MVETTVDVGRCARNDGRGWRCKFQCFGGSSYCEKHHHYLHIRAEVEGSPTADEDRCTRNDGKGWRCKSRRFGGTRYCEKHHLLREASRVRVSGASAGKKTTKKQSTGSTVDDDRCIRSGCRCSSPRCGERRYCEKHHLQSLSGASSKFKVRVSQASVEEEVEQEKKLEEGEALGASISSEINEKMSRACESEMGGGEEEAENVSISAAPFERKKRGRPSKPKNSEGVENVGVSAASVERKKRGRPSKPKDSEGAENVSVSAASVERKKRGRPSKSKNVSVAGPSFEREKSGCPSKAKNLEGIEKKKWRRNAGRPLKMSRVELGGAEEGGRILELGQVWAFPKECDGFPRSYARIDSIIPLPLPSVVRVTPLVPHPVTDDEKLLDEQGFSLACGLFKASESTATKEISAFTHKVQFEIEGKPGSFFNIFPKEGEIWAIYLRWDALTKTFDYQLVEVVSDFDEEEGVKVFAMVKVEGRDGVYRRQEYAGFHLVRSFSRGFMAMFSHKVPSSRIVEGGYSIFVSSSGWKLMTDSCHNLLEKLCNRSKSSCAGLCLVPRCCSGRIQVQAGGKEAA